MPSKNPKSTGRSKKLKRRAGDNGKGRRATIVKPPSNLGSLIPTPVYDTYWRFAAERQRIFFQRLEHRPWPWTDDSILRTYKFTNAYRASDRVSQYLLRNVIYRKDLPRTANEVFFRILLFKLFNKIETWEKIERELGPPTYADYSFERYDHILNSAMMRGESIYSAAYIMPSAGALGYTRKHRNHLTLIERMMTDELPVRLANAGSMQEAFALIRGFPSIGNFLAYQYVTDVNYSHIMNFDETDFVVAGPGAINGIRKCFVNTGGMTDANVIRVMADRQELEFERLGLRFQSLWGRRLQLIDCQNLFCEVDKYARVAHPDISGFSNRTRIKQRLHPNNHRIPFWYPPKWNINGAVTDYVAGIATSTALLTA